MRENATWTPLAPPNWYEERTYQWGGFVAQQKLTCQKEIFRADEPLTNLQT